MIYLDNNATTPIAAEVLDAMRQCLETSFGNPSAAYSLSRDSRRVLMDTRVSVAKLLGVSASDEIVFTSGGTESDTWAIFGAIRNRTDCHVITTKVEHDAVLKVFQTLESRGLRVTWLEVDSEGSLDLDALRAALSPDTAIVSTMLANNETGVIFPIDEIGQIVKANSNALFHVDGVNAVGKIAIDLANSPVDLFSLSAHKFHGPKGVGALFVRKGVEMSPYLIGGGQEFGRRAGTEAVHQIAGLGAAARLASDLSKMVEVERLRDRLENEILAKVPDSSLNGTRDSSKRLPNTSNISFENTNGEMILYGLDRAGIAVSTGSACHAHDHRSSHVLEAMDVPYSRAMGSIRFSLGRTNSEEDINKLLSVLPSLIAELRSLNIV